MEPDYISHRLYLTNFNSQNNLVVPFQITWLPQSSKNLSGSHIITNDFNWSLNIFHILSPAQHIPTMKKTTPPKSKKKLVDCPYNKKKTESPGVKVVIKALYISISTRLSLTISLQFFTHHTHTPKCLAHPIPKLSTLFKFSQWNHHILL